MPAKFKTVQDYIASLPQDRQEAILAVRDVVVKNLPKGVEEGIQYGMIGYFIPHSVYPDGYHCNPSEPLPFAHIASQKNHMAVYLMCIYGKDEHVEWFKNAWQKTGKRLDMGKSCVRFKKLENVALDVIGKAVKKVSVKQFVAHYENTIKTGGKRTTEKAVSKTKAAKKQVAKPKKSAVAKSVAVQPKRATKKTVVAAKKKSVKKSPATKAKASASTTKKVATKRNVGLKKKSVRAKKK